MSIFEKKKKKRASIVALFTALAVAGAALLYGNKDNARESTERAAKQISIWKLD